MQDKCECTVPSWVLMSPVSASPKTFDTALQHKVSWRHLSSKHWHQLDFVLIRHRDLNSVKLTYSHQRADYDIDHYLIYSRVKHQPRRIHRSKKDARPGIKMNNMCSLGRAKEFAQALEGALSERPNSTVSERWEHWGMSSITLPSLPLARDKWRQLNGLPLMLMRWYHSLRKRICILLMNKNSLTVTNLQAHGATHSRVQLTTRHCANDYWVPALLQDSSFCWHRKHKGLAWSVKVQIGSLEKVQIGRFFIMHWMLCNTGSPSIKGAVIMKALVAVYIWFISLLVAITPSQLLQSYASHVMPSLL